jgi:hypothetical protein
VTEPGALTAAARGWHVFPLAPGHKTPRRQLTDWEAKATTDPARIERWWHTHPRDNVGIATGPSGLVVVDLDPAKTGDTPPERFAGASGGADVLDELARQHGTQLAPTWTVQTPSGGHHRYYLAPAGRELRNTAGRIGWRIDTRAAGGFVVAAGSTVAGRPYVVVDHTAPIELPRWILELADPPAPPAPARPLLPVCRARGYVETALANEVQRVLDATSGTRNTTLYLAACALRRFVEQGVLARHVVEAALQAAGEAGGQHHREVAATVRSALDARYRRGPAI